MEVVVNGTQKQRWPAAEKHYRKMSLNYVEPALRYAQVMASRPWYSPHKISQIIGLIKNLEKLMALYKGPITRDMEEALEAASNYFVSAMRLLDQLDS
jgi:hypothetical protein